MASFPTMLRHDRERHGFTVGQVAWRLGVSPEVYRALEAGERSPDFDTWTRICDLYGWPRTFAGGRRAGRSGPGDGRDFGVGVISAEA